MDIGLTMSPSLHVANLIASGKVCAPRNDTKWLRFYTANMPKKSRPIIAVTWYLREWMDSLGVRQKDMMDRTGWSKTTASLLYNCQQDMNPELLRAAAAALNRKTYELLMPPAEAFRIIRHRQVVEDEALRLVAEQPSRYIPEPPDLTGPKSEGQSYDEHPNGLRRAS